MKTFTIDDARVEDSHDAKAHRKLWGAVFLLGLRDAALSFRHWHAKPHPEVALEDFAAVFWVYSDDDHAGGFLWLCSMFEIDPGRARIEWRKRVLEVMANKGKKHHVKLQAVIAEAIVDEAEDEGEDD